MDKMQDKMPDTRKDTDDENIEEKDNARKTIKEFISNNGLYALLLLCIAVTGLAAAAFVYVNTGEEQKPKDVTRSKDQSIKDARATDDAQKLLDALTESIPNRIPSPNPRMDDASEVGGNAKTLLNPPVEGKVLWGFAVDELIYSKTLNQWMTHEGVDVAGKLGASVKSVNAGKVKKLYSDSAFGVTVVVEHTDGSSAVYANLAENTEVKEGDSVKVGTVLGYIGKTAVCECAEESHLHFEYHADGKAVDPSKYVLFVK